MRRRQSYSDAFKKQFEHETKKNRKIKFVINFSVLIIIIVFIIGTNFHSQRKLHVF